MINRIPFKCLLISSLSGLTRKRGMARTSLAIPTRFLVAPDKLDIKRHKHGILYVFSFQFDPNPKEQIVFEKLPDLSSRTSQPPSESQDTYRPY